MINVLDLDDSAKIPGIYYILNINKNRVYIGSAKNIRVRLMDHHNKLKRNKHPSLFLQNDWNKTEDKSCFKIIIAEEVPIEFLIQQEQEYLNILYDNQQNCYNINLQAHSCIGVKRRQETKDKISLALTGIKRTPEQKAKMSEIGKKIYDGHLTGWMTGKKGKLHHGSVPIEQYDAKTGEFIAEYECIEQAFEKTGLYNIQNCHNKTRKTAGGFYWIKKGIEKLAKEEVLQAVKPTPQKGRKVHRIPKQIYQFDLNKNLIKTYKSVGEASKNFKHTKRNHKQVL